MWEYFAFLPEDILWERNGKLEPKREMLIRTCMSIKKDWSKKNGTFAA